MTFLHLESRVACGLCGRRLAGFTVGTYRVNKDTFVMTGKGPGLGWHEETCRECGFVNGPVSRERWRLTPESRRAVNAVYAKRGWPEVAT
jgi:hypothetical protein